jgi:hypothetical protein
MTISTLNNVITGDFITNLSSSSKSTKVGLSKQPEEALSVTLQRGARSAAASIQSLNSGISYINIARDYTDQMLNVVDALQALVDRAGKGNITPNNAKVYKSSFDKLAKAYDELVSGSVVKGRDLLSVDDMSAVLKQGGLDPDKVSELESAFKKISTFSGVEVTSTGDTRSSAALFPSEDFYRALRQATRDPEDPVQDSDGSAAFTNIRRAVQEIHDKVSNNIKALDTAAELVKKNLELVRATGFAFLNASNSIGTAESVDTIALKVRGEIRSKAGGNLSEAHNLKSILAAGLLSLSQKS